MKKIDEKKLRERTALMLMVMDIIETESKKIENSRKRINKAIDLIKNKKYYTDKELKISEMVRLIGKDIYDAYNKAVLEEVWKDQFVKYGEIIMEEEIIKNTPVTRYCNNCKKTTTHIKVESNRNMAIESLYMCLNCSKEEGNK